METRLYPDNLLRTFFNLFFPRICPICLKDIETDGLCNGCLAGIKFIESPLCKICGVPFISKADKDHACGRCLTHTTPFVKARSAAYYDGILADALCRFKYAGDFALTKTLTLLTLKAIDILGENSFDMVVPVPLHKNKLKERGFNQSLALSREVAKKLSIGVDYLNLKRIRPTLPQTELKGKERLMNVRAAFEVKDKTAFKGKRVLLIDDVYTTGSTIRECAKVLKKSGAFVFAATPARVSTV